STWHRETVWDGEPLDPDHRIHLALALDSTNRPVIACGRDGEDFLLCRKNAQNLWSDISVPGTACALEDMDITLDDAGTVHLLWRTGTKVFYASGIDGFSSVKTIDERGSFPGKFISNVEIAIDGHGSILAGYSIGDYSTYDEKYGKWTEFFIRDIRPESQNIVAGYSGMNRNIVRTLSMLPDRFGDMHYASVLTNYAGCPPPYRNIYFGKLTGYPTGLKRKTEYFQVLSLVPDSRGNPWICDGYTIYSYDLNSETPESWWIDGYWQTIDNMVSEGMTEFVDMRLTARDHPVFCHRLSGDLVVSTALPHPIDLHLAMPGNYFAPGDTFRLELSIQSDETLYGTYPLWCILDIGGQFFYWPSWTTQPDYQSLTVEEGDNTFTIIPEFSWPDGIPGVTYGIFYAGLMTFNNSAFHEDSSGLEILSFNVGPPL
ncbi:MAG TPA: hypothetical protein PLV45_06065, partial [bacterium]|nr:hypothetical protein [bacterium]